jgi:hypothetical protein
MNRFLSIINIFLWMTLSVFGQAPTKTRDLWKSKNYAGWEFITPSSTDIQLVCQRVSDSVVHVAGKPIGYLATIDSYENYTLHFEYRWPMDAAQNSNSGVLVHISSGPIDRNIWPVCFQIQTKISRVGDILPMPGAKFFEPLSSAPDAKTPLLERQKSDCEKPVGQWNFVDIVCRDSTIECSMNGIILNHVSKCSPHAGRIGLQLEGVPFELCNMRLTLFE